MLRRLLAAAALTAAACHRTPPETVFLNFDPASGAHALVAGWSSFEQTPEGDTFMWSDALEARIALQSPADGDRLLRFRCWPYWHDGAPDQTVALALNGKALETVRLINDRHVYTVYVPRGDWRRGPNELRLVFAHRDRPADHGGGPDRRSLAVAFDWMEVVPPARPHP